jgi:hypothetical protein
LAVATLWLWVIVKPSLSNIVNHTKKIFQCGYILNMLIFFTEFLILYHCPCTCH